MNFFPSVYHPKYFCLSNQFLFIRETRVKSTRIKKDSVQWTDCVRLKLDELVYELNVKHAWIDKITVLNCEEQITIDFLLNLSWNWKVYFSLQFFQLCILMRWQTPFLAEMRTPTYAKCQYSTIRCNTTIWHSVERLAGHVCLDKCGLFLLQLIAVCCGFPTCTDR